MALEAVRSKAVVLLLIRCCLLLPLWDSVNSMFCCALICVYSSFAIISMGKRERLSAVCDCGISYYFFKYDMVHIRLAPVLKTIFHQCVILYTCSQSYSDGSVLNRAIRVRLATSI